MPSPVALDNTFGAFLIGLTLSTTLFGVSCLQLYQFYVKSSSRKSDVLRILLPSLVALDAFSVALATHTLYHYLISNFGNYNALKHIVWSWNLQIPVAASIAACVQSVYAYRIYILYRRSWVMLVSIIIVFLGLIEIATGIGHFVSNIHMQGLSQEQENTPWTTTTIVCAVFAELIQSITLIQYFKTSRERFPESKKGLDLLIIYTVNTGALTTIFLTATLILWLLFNTTSVDSPTFLIAMRLYPCSLLSVLNSRDTVRQKLDSGHPHHVDLDTTDMTLSNLRFQTGCTSSETRDLEGTRQEYSEDSRSKKEIC